MTELARIVGQRIRAYRTAQGLSQEKLAELAGCHPTYIGQVERGEKNATLESMDKIACALQLPLSQLFETLGGSAADSIARKCYDLIARKTPAEQEHLYSMLLEIDKYKNQ